MDNKSFLNLSPKDCYTIYPKILNSSQRHLASAKLLAESNDFGNAVAHLILSSEELVKSFILFLDGVGCDIRKIKGSSQLFNQHIPRHKFLYYLSSIIILFNDFKNNLFQKIKFSQKFKKFITSSCNIKEDEVLHFIHSHNDIESLTTAFHESYPQEKINSENTFKKLTNEFILHTEFWKNADKLKQHGFYVDYENGLLIPDNISYDNFQNSFEIIKVHHNFIIELIKFLDDLLYNHAKTAEQKESLIDAINYTMKIFINLTASKKQ